MGVWSACEMVRYQSSGGAAGYCGRLVKPPGIEAEAQRGDGRTAADDPRDQLTPDPPLRRIPADALEWGAVAYLRFDSS